MSLIKYPYTNLHELNLDWLIEQLNNPDGPVRSVNGKSGIVTLTGEDIARSTSNPETVAAALQTQGSSIQTVRNQIGVTPLPTVAQTLTGAIAENAQTIADVEDNVIGNTELPTEAQTLTGAIAENADNIGGNAESITNINNKIGTTALPTTNQTLTGAIAENAQGITTLNNQTVNRSSTIVSIPVGTTAGLFDAGMLATLFNKQGLDQSYIITTFGYIRAGNTTTMDNEVPILVYNNHLYIKVAGTVSNTEISIGVTIQYKMP